MITLVWKKEDVCQSASYPTSREGHSFTYISTLQQYFLFGGISSKRHNELFFYDSKTNGWNLIDSKGKGPLARCYHVAWYDEPHFFIHGGKQSDKGQLSDVYCYNIESMSWKKFFSMESPLPRSQHAAIVANSGIGLVFGGYCASKNLLLNDMWTFDYNSVPFSTQKSNELPGGIWTKHPQTGNVPNGRRGHTLTKIPNQQKAILYGGFTHLSNSAGQVQDNQFYILDIKTFSWSILNLMGQYPEPRGLHVLQFFKDTQLIIFGGISTDDCQGEQRPKVFDDFHMLDLKDNFFSAPFTANIRPSARYGHACDSNLKTFLDKKGMSQTQSLQIGEFEPMHELIILGGLDSQYCTMDPFILQDKIITEHTKWELTQVSKVKSDNANNLESSVKLANKNIMENRKIIAKLERNLSDMSEELASLKYKKRQMEDELDLKIKSYKEAVKQFKDQDRRLISDKQRHEDRIIAMQNLIELEQKMQAVIVRKIDVIERNFAKSEQFIITLDTFLNTAKTKLNHNSGYGLPQSALPGEVDLAFLDSQKNQHKQNLKQIMHYYQNFEQNHKEITNKLELQREDQGQFENEMRQLHEIQVVSKSDLVDKLKSID
eukprot:403367137